MFHLTGFPLIYIIFFLNVINTHTVTEANSCVTKSSFRTAAQFIVFSHLGYPRPEAVKWINASFGATTRNDIWRAVHRPSVPSPYIRAQLGNFDFIFFTSQDH